MRVYSSQLALFVFSLYLVNKHFTH
jgi:hypothetical protein